MTISHITYTFKNTIYIQYTQYTHIYAVIEIKSIIKK